MRKLPFVTRSYSQNAALSALSLENKIPSRVIYPTPESKASTTKTSVT